MSDEPETPDEDDEEALERWNDESPAPSPEPPPEQTAHCVSRSVCVPCGAEVTHEGAGEAFVRLGFADEASPLTGDDAGRLPRSLHAAAS